MSEKVAFITDGIRPNREFGESTLDISRIWGYLYIDNIVIAEIPKLSGWFLEEYLTEYTSEWLKREGFYQYWQIYYKLKNSQTGEIAYFGNNKPQKEVQFGLNADFIRDYANLSGGAIVTKELPSAEEFQQDIFIKSALNGEGLSGYSSANTGIKENGESKGFEEFWDLYIAARRWDQDNEKIFDSTTWFFADTTELEAEYINYGYNPSNVSLSERTLAAKPKAGDLVGKLTASDPDENDTHTFILLDESLTISPVDGNAFRIEGDKLFIKDQTLIDSKESFDIKIGAIDSKGLYSRWQSITIKKAKENNAPSDVEVSVASIQEGLPGGTSVATVSSSDPDSDDPHSYSLATGEGDTDNSAFKVEGNKLIIINSPDYETKSSYSIRLRTTDAGGLSFEKSFTLSVNEVNESPNNIQASSTNFKENIPSDTSIGILSSTDPDSNDTHTYALVSGEGDTDNSAFNIVGDQLKIKSSPDYETQDSYSVRLQTEDSDGLTFEKSFIFAVNDLNEDPTNLSISTTTFDENIAADSVAATLSSTDQDDGDTFTYSLIDGTGDADNTSFTIDGDQLKIKSSPDYETQKSYSVRLQTTDSDDLTFEKAFTFSVNDLEEESNSGDTFAEYGQTSINHNWQTINLDQTYTNAVIIASDPTLKGGDPVAVRIRNVGTDSFQVRLQEPNYKDGSHTNETISYLVAEAGDWELSDGTRISVGTQTSNKLSSAGFETIDLESGFTGSPAVLTQTQTFNGSDWVTTRTKDIGTGSFQVTMQEEEQLNGGAHAQETIGWIAVDSGDSSDGDTQLASGLTADIFTQATKTHTFGSSFDSAPTLLTKLSTFDGADVANSRIKSVSNTGFSAMVQEEQSKDSEIAHTTESLAFLALDGTSGTLEGTAYQPTQTIGEYGQISVNHQWTSIDLTNTYTSPIVITSDPTIKGGDPTVVRLRNIDSNSFDLRLQETNYKDGRHTNEVISYVVLEEGTWDLADGTQIAAGSKKTNKLSTQSREKVSFDDSFTSGPAVLTQTQTFNGSDWVTTRTDAITGNSFDVMLQEEEQLNNGGHTTETIGWVAMDQGVATDGDTIIEGGMTPDVFTQATKTHTFDGSFDSAPTLLTKLSTFDGADVANSRIKSVSNTGFSAMVQEEQSKDSEIAHTTESLSFLAFNGSSGIIEAAI